MNTSSPNLPEIAVSVIVPVYNSGASLVKCLNSLAAQTLTDIEFVCIDDGSTDGSPAELDSWAARDSRFRVMHQPNGGYGKAMNRGLLAAKGQFIGIVEPDDWIEPDMYERLLDLAKTTGADIAKSDYVIEKANTSRKAGKFNHLKEGICDNLINMPAYLDGAPCIWTAIYRRKFLAENNIRFTETPGASFQDLGFGIRTWLAAKSIAITQNAFYHYWEDNPLSSSRRMEDGAWAAYKEIELLAGDFNRIPTSESAIRSLIVKRIFTTLRADYRLRIRHTAKNFLLKYSRLLKKHFPLDTLRKDCFTANEWNDILLIYNTPLIFPRKSRTSTNRLQRICSCRTEAGQRILRIMGMYFVLSAKNRTAQ